MNNSASGTIPANDAAPQRAVKPQYLKPIFGDVLQELKALRNWVVWRAEQPPRPGQKWRKVPYIAHAGKPAAASTTDPSTWRTFGEAVAAYEASQRWPRPLDGIGFVFDGETGEDGLCYCGVDLDKWTDREQSIFAKVASYTETSPSGNGVHIIMRAAPFKQETCKTEALSAEAYCTGRYFTFSGRLVEGSVATIEARPNEIAEVLAEIKAASDHANRDRTGAQKKEPTNYLARLRRGTLEQTQQQAITQSALFADLPLEDLCGPGEPLNMEKFKSALWGLPDEWLAAEPNWKLICLICANEAMHNGGDVALKQALWEAWDERSRAVEGYDEADNRDHFDRFVGGYGKVKPPILAGSLYQEAERWGWVWTPTPSNDDVAAVTSVASNAAGGASAGSAVRREVKPLKGRSVYAQTRNLLMRLPYPFSYDEFHDRCFYEGEPLTDALVGRLREYCINASEDHKDPSLKTVWDSRQCGKQRRPCATAIALIRRRIGSMGSCGTAFPA
jgi:hypothetical protein